MFKNRRWALFAPFAMLGAIVLAACQPAAPQTVEVTRVVTETVEVEGEPQEVTRVVVETQVVEVTPEVEEEEVEGPKDLIICMAQEPDTMYPYGGSMLAAAAVQHAIFENNFTNLSYEYQPQGLEKLPSLEDGDAVVNSVEVNAGDLVLGADGNPVELAEGVMVRTSDGETVEFTGEPLMMDQLSAEFTMHQRFWSDGEPVTADDSVYAFEMASHPDTPTTKFTIERTASYEATGELSTRWTGIPGYMDSEFFINFWGPFPRHAWEQYSPAELLEAEDVSRLPIGDGAFRIVEWVAGDQIYLEPNEHYYRADEGLPYLDSLTYKFIPDTNQLIAQLLAGQCDIGTQDGMDVGQSPFLIEAESNGLLVPYFETGTVYEHIDFNILPVPEYAQTRPDWFSDVRVRQAMTMCTDRQGMVDNILYGRSEVIHTYIPSVHPLYPQEGLTEWAYDVEAANALLDEVGYVDSDGDGIREDPATGTPFSVRLGTTAGNEMRQQLTQIFKENMLECGIDVQLYYPPASEWFAEGPDGEMFGRRYDLGEFAWLTGVQPACDLYLSTQIPGPEGEPIPGHYAGASYLGWGGQNNAGYISEEFDLACNRALGNLPGTEDYEEGHMEAQRIFSRDVPVIPLFLRLKVAATRPEVLNFNIDPTQNSELYNVHELDLQR